MTESSGGIELGLFTYICFWFPDTGPPITGASHNLKNANQQKKTNKK